jgi:hypothetical protein
MDRSEEIVDNPDRGVAEHIRDYVTTGGRRGHRLSGWKASTLLLVTRGRRLRTRHRRRRGARVRRRAGRSGPAGSPAGRGYSASALGFEGGNGVHRNRLFGYSSRKERCT